MKQGELGRPCRINPFHSFVPGCDTRQLSQKKIEVFEWNFHGKQFNCYFFGRVCVPTSQLEKHVLTHAGEKITIVKNVEKLLHQSLMVHIMSTSVMAMTGSRRRYCMSKLRKSFYNKSSTSQTHKVNSCANVFKQAIPL